MRHSTLITATLMALFIVIISACNKNDLSPKIGLINSDFKNIQLNTGFTDNGIPVNAENWSVEYVKDGATGESLKDEDGKSMSLLGVGAVELDAGWLRLEKKNGDNLLSISLKENFSDDPRKFTIGILADGKKDELSFVQTRGEGYAILKKEITEVPGSRREYTSDEGIRTITLSNNSSTAQYMETSGIFTDVKHLSEFKSDDYGAFDWPAEQDTLIFMDELSREGAIYWADNVPYREGVSEEPFLKPGDKDELLVQPLTNINVRGEMLYLERESLYVFTIKNLSSGHTFEVSGSWKQKIPLVPTTHIFE